MDQKQNPAPDQKRVERLKLIVEKLAAGASPAEVKREFHALIRNTDAGEVAALEQALIDSGTPVEEVLRLCEVHASVFKAGLERGKREEEMSGHPVHTFKAENKMLKKKLKSLRFSGLKNLDSLKTAVDALRPLIIHYERKENQLFPYLERAGFTGPSKVMWGKHDEIRELFRNFENAYTADNKALAKRTVRTLVHKARMMIFMEEKILFPNALRRLSSRDWADIRRGEEAIGFAWVKPGSDWDPLFATNPSGIVGIPEFGTSQKGKALAGETVIPLSEGSLPLSWLNRILTMLPLDLSFVDADDKVRYYSDSPERVFPRSPGVIGRSVQNCHPPKSVHMVEKILTSFKSGEKSDAAFWIQMGERFIHISYKAVRDEKGTYLGCLEMSMDATELRSLSGEHRLLDW